MNGSKGSKCFLNLLVSVAIWEKACRRYICEKALCESGTEIPQLDHCRCRIRRSPVQAAISLIIIEEPFA